MPDTSHLKPLQRQALTTLLTAPDHALLRCRGGYAPYAGAPVFTIRTVNGLQAEGLVTFEPTQFPSTIRLSRDGQALARALRKAKTGKAVRV
jgi:hypothetical protein